VPPTTHRTDVWTQQAKVTVPDGTAASGSVFGSVSVSQDLAMVGASLDNEAQGAVYTFQRKHHKAMERNKPSR